MNLPTKNDYDQGLLTIGFPELYVRGCRFTSHLWYPRNEKTPQERAFLGDGNNWKKESQQGGFTKFWNEQVIFDRKTLCCLLLLLGFGNIH